MFVFFFHVRAFFRCFFFLFSPAVHFCWCLFPVRFFFGCRKQAELLALRATERGAEMVQVGSDRITSANIVLADPLLSSAFLRRALPTILLQLYDQHYLKIVDCQWLSECIRLKERTLTDRFEVVCAPDTPSPAPSSLLTPRLHSSSLSVSSVASHSVPPSSAFPASGPSEIPQFLPNSSAGPTLESNKLSSITSESVGAAFVSSASFTSDQEWLKVRSIFNLHISKHEVANQFFLSVLAFFCTRSMFFSDVVIFFVLSSVLFCFPFFSF
jgi:hypothetical protein